jgi:hypothetical protein
VVLRPRRRRDDAGADHPAAATCGRAFPMNWMKAPIRYRDLDELNAMFERNARKDGPRRTARPPPLVSKSLTGQAGPTVTVGC